MSEEPTTEGLVEDFLEGFRRGDVPDEDSFIAAHPKQANELKDLLPLLVEMEDYGRERRQRDNRAADVPPSLPGSDYALQKKIDQKRAQLSDFILIEGGELNGVKYNKAEDYGYEAATRKEGDETYDRPAIEELIRWRLWDRTGG